MEFPVADKHDPARAASLRQIYITQRLPEIRGELDKLRAEREQIQENWDTADDAKRRELRRRKIYVATRSETLRTERADLAAERSQWKAARAAGDEQPASE
jgi:hypothetical protein